MSKAADTRHSMTPSPFVIQWTDAIARAAPAPARALDVAMGRGRHALALARAGFRTFGVDAALDAVRDAVASAAAAGFLVRGWCADLTRSPLPRERFELVLVTRFLQRDLFGSIRQAVVPAVLLPARLLERLGVGRRLAARPVRVGPADLRASVALGCAALALTLLFPTVLHPLTWGAVWLIAEPVLYQRSPDRSLFGDVARGEWGRIVRLMAAGLFAGALWESFNHLARGKWIYTVPFLEDVKLFEMPPIGFLGFPLFALEVWSLYQLLARRPRAATVVPSVAFAVLVLAGMDRWTVSSTTPRLADLPAVSAEARTRLVDAGLTDVFLLAQLPADEISRRAGLDHDGATSVREAARLSTLRGIGTRHAAVLAAGGIRTIADLAAASPETVWRIAHRGPRPTLPEVRVWVRAARRAVGAGDPR